MRPSCRPHYASCRSVYPSVCPVRARNSKRKKRTKTKRGIDVSQGTSKWSANFQLKRSKFKVTGRQNPQKTGVVFTYGRPIKRRRLRRRLQTRPTPSLGLIYCRRSRVQTLGNWTDGRISCRHSAASCFLVALSFRPRSVKRMCDALCRLSTCSWRSSWTTSTT